MEQPKKTSRTPLYLTLIVAGVFIAGAALFPFLINAQDKALQAAEIAAPPVKLNTAAPQLSLASLGGGTAGLADYRGQLVLVNNWATWCPPCIAEMPELQAYYAAHAAQGFVLVGIESGDPAATVAAFVKKNKLTFPILLDPPGKALEAFANWNLPSSYLIDRTGNLILGWTGPVNQATLDQYVTPLLEK